MDLPYCAGDSRCPYTLDQIKAWKAKPISQRRAPPKVTISDHEGHGCFIGDDEHYHPAVQDAGKLTNVMFCQTQLKDNKTPVKTAAAEYTLHGASVDFTGQGVRISTGGKYCRLAFHDRNGKGDGQYRILCDQDSSNTAEKFHIAGLGNGQYSLQDSTGSYCEMGWGIRCRFRQAVTAGGRFTIGTYKPPGTKTTTTSKTTTTTTTIITTATTTTTSTITKTTITTEDCGVHLDQQIKLLETSMQSTITSLRQSIANLAAANLDTDELVQEADALEAAMRATC